MSYELVLFYDWPGATGSLRIGNGVVVQSHPTTYPGTPRPGLGFACPDGSPQGWGADVTFNAPGKYPVSVKGILWFNDSRTPYPWNPGQQAALSFDDATQSAIPIPSTPVDPDGPFNPDANPMAIINSVYNTGLYNLATHDGCGKFTEECCKQLHLQHSVMWGHIKKNPGQEQYNGHAIDAIQLLNAMPNCDRGIYDIIVGSQAPGAHPALNRVSDPNSALWYYPA